MNTLVDFKNRWKTNGRYASHPEAARLTLLYDEIVDLEVQYIKQADALKLTSNPDIYTQGNSNLLRIKEELNTVMNTFARVLYASSSGNKKSADDKWARPGSVSPRPKRGTY